LEKVWNGSNTGVSAHKANRLLSFVTLVVSISFFQFKFLLFFFALEGQVDRYEVIIMGNDTLLGAVNVTDRTVLSGYVVNFTIPTVSKECNHKVV
jgi:hypothetical protein